MKSGWSIRPVSRLRGFWHRLWSSVRCGLLRAKGVQLGAGVRVLGLPVVARESRSTIAIGNNVVLTSALRMTALGVARPVILRTLAAGAEIVVGDDTGMSGATVCAIQSVRIGKRCLFGADVLVADTDFHEVDEIPRRYLPLPASEGKDAVVIGDDVFLGARSIVLKGVSIGNGSVIGAGSVVADDIPAGFVAAGNPARVIRALRHQ